MSIQPTSVEQTHDDLSKGEPDPGRVAEVEHEQDWLGPGVADGAMEKVEARMHEASIKE